MYEQFTIPGRVAVVEHDGAQFLTVKNQLAEAEICLAGAHVTKFRPAGQEELLWMSPLTGYGVGKKIRGGVPICWPWFSKNTENPDLPMHGFIRTMLWRLDGVKELPDGSTEAVLSIRDSEESRALWNHKFQLFLTVNIGSALTLKLKTVNTGDQPFTIGQALHTYFRVGDIAAVSIDGFDGKSCLNKVGNDFTQHGPIVIDKEVDEVFHDVPDGSVIHDTSLKRDIVITKGNSRTSVVWNPWIAKSKSMADFPDDGYLTMVCVETTNALEDVRVVQPGETLEMTTAYALR